MVLVVVVTDVKKETILVLNKESRPLKSSWCRILFTYIKMAKRSVCKTTTSQLKHRKGACCSPIVYVFLNKMHYLSIAL